jgi:hypothetical protein
MVTPEWLPFTLSKTPMGLLLPNGNYRIIRMSSIRQQHQVRGERAVVSNEPDHTTIQDRYAAQIAADLERNMQEQQELRARLDQLQKEHAWLSTMNGTLVGESTTPKPPAEATGDSTEAPAAQTTAASGVVPQPRRGRKATSKTGGSREKAAQAKPGGKPKTGARKSDGPPLRELVLGLLAQHHEPSMVGEVVKELTQAHPERTASPQVVRNTLEGLVAKGDVERERKQGSVFYTALRKPDTTDTTPEAAEGMVSAEV